MLEQPSETFTANKVGLSVFYDCIDLSPTDEKQDKMKHDRSDTEEESESIIWVMYLNGFFFFNYSYHLICDAIIKSTGSDHSNILSF